MDFTDELNSFFAAAIKKAKNKPPRFPDWTYPDGKQPEKHEGRTTVLKYFSKADMAKSLYENNWGIIYYDDLG